MQKEDVLRKRYLSSQHIQARGAAFRHPRPRFFRTISKFEKVGPTRFPDGLALRTTSRSFLCNIFGVSPPTAVEQHSPPPDHLFVFIPPKTSHT
jgi:hypothetical protein